jgi:hypothetical protein
MRIYTRFFFGILFNKWSGGSLLILTVQFRP